MQSIITVGRGPDFCLFEGLVIHSHKVNIEITDAESTQNFCRTITDRSLAQVCTHIKSILRNQLHLSTCKFKWHDTSPRSGKCEAGNFSIIITYQLPVALTIHQREKLEMQFNKFVEKK